MNNCLGCNTEMTPEEIMWNGNVCNSCKIKEITKQNITLKRALKTLSKKFIIALGMYNEEKVKDFEELAQTQMNYEIKQAEESLKNDN